MLCSACDEQQWVVLTLTDIKGQDGCLIEQEVPVCQSLLLRNTGNSTTRKI